MSRPERDHGGGITSPNATVMSPIPTYTTSNHEHGGAYTSPNATVITPKAQPEASTWSSVSISGPTYQTPPQQSRTVDNEAASYDMGTRHPMEIVHDNGQLELPTTVAYPIGYRNLFNIRSRLKWKYPNIYEEPVLRYIPDDERFHRDTMSRIHTSSEDDRYISPSDGHLAKLVVQAVDEIYKQGLNSTYRRTFVRNAAPLILRVAIFPFRGLPENRDLWSRRDWAMMAGRWLISCAGLLCFMSVPVAGAGQVRNGGKYDAFAYRYWGYPKVARNPCEGQIMRKTIRGIGMSGESQQEEFVDDPRVVTNVVMERICEPRYLCFLNSMKDCDDYSFTIWLVEDWKKKHPNIESRDMRYVVVAYTSNQFDSNSAADNDDLEHIAVRAARDHGVPAYWCGHNCMRDKAELEDDVYRISDVIRGSYAVTIALGRGGDASSGEKKDPMALLRDWGDRMWTLPEVLLAPARHPIRVYTSASIPVPPFEIAKQNFAASVWDDSSVSRQLVDHYEGSLTLGRLELVTLALSCLSNRTTSGQHLSGDIAYILMGLLRRRPVVSAQDSAFEAFARLSIANDSDMLLERLICTLPTSPSQEWYDMTDAFHINLWDIYPTCQIAGIGGSTGNPDTVILDGAFGAAIRWKSFAPVAYTTNESWRRLLSLLVVRGAPTVFVVACALISLKGSAAPVVWKLGAVLLLYSLLVVLTAPMFIQILYSGKLWGTQAWFFGFEGYMPIDLIEGQIFGACFNRLSWSSSGSSLSRHKMNEYGECVGVDPTSDPFIARIVKASAHAPMGQPRVFTLVDTNTLTVTLFQATRPPIAVLVCGSEGGMQRAVLASYEWKSQTLYRETVVRMETQVLECMMRVSRIRLGLKRPLGPNATG